MDLNVPWCPVSIPYGSDVAWSEKQSCIVVHSSPVDASVALIVFIHSSVILKWTYSSDWQPEFCCGKSLAGTAWCGLFGKAKEATICYTWASILLEGNCGKGAGQYNFRSSRIIAPTSRSENASWRKMSSVSANLTCVGGKLKCVLHFETLTIYMSCELERGVIHVGLCSVVRCMRKHLE